jgi:hypothetical protein
MTMALCVLGGLLFLVIVGRHNEAATARDWEMALSPMGEAILAEVAEGVQAQTFMIETSYKTAERQRAHGSMDEAVRLLSVGSRAVEACAPSMLHLVKSIGVLARQAAAIAPVTPLRPQAFRSSELRTVAGLAALAHHFLVSARERLGLRLAVLRHGFRAVVGRILRATDAAAATPDEERQWARVGALRADLGTLTEESLGTLRLVLASLGAVPAATGRPARRPAA